MSTSNWTTVRQKATQASNDIARQAVMKFPDFLLKNGIITDEQYRRLIDRLAATSTHRPGYDVLLDEPVAGGADGIVAEVKSNNPCAGSSFGSNQQTAIRKDLDTLTGLTSPKSDTSIANHYKFLVLLDDGYGNVLAAIQKLIASYNAAHSGCAQVVLWGSKPLNTADVFVVIL